MCLCFLAGCTRSKTIPDDKLEQIFAEIFLANAYVVSGVDNFRLDTLDIYRPILDKYGYEVEDLTYTVQNYSERKSAKISEVVEKAIQRLEKGEREYTELVASRDTTNAIALRKFSKTVYYDTAIVVKSLADTSRLRITIPVTEGSYAVTYHYLIDSLDRNGNSRSRYDMLNNSGYSTNNISHAAVIRRPSGSSRNIAAYGYDSVLVLSLAGYGPGMQRPSVRIDSIRIVYSPTLKMALDSLSRYYATSVFKLYPDDAGPQGNSQDRGTLGIHPAGIPEGGDANP